MKPRAWGRWGRTKTSSVSLAPGSPCLKAECQAGRMFQLLSVFSWSLPNPGQWWGTGKYFSHVKLYCYTSWLKAWMTSVEEGVVEGSFLAFIPSTEGDSKGWHGLCLTHIMMRTRSWIFCRSFTHCSTVKNSRLCCRCKERESVKAQGQQLGTQGVPKLYCTSSSEGRSNCGPEASMLKHDKHPGCTQE